ncbi:MAG: hypothetical protein Q8P27_03335 [Candidatus Peregrinibacteria bacterium]|nr:hypothetical protein [Candidatus Peregrinibacteria bacterium]
MYCIVPLAGPDFYQESYGIKPLFEYNGGPLIETILKSRSWHDRIETFIFVLKEGPHVAEFVGFAQKMFPNSQFVTISEYTKGALMSAAVGASLITDFSQPVVLDLVDIDYDSSGLNPAELFSKGYIQGILPYFRAEDPCYSYLVTDEQGFLLESAEKRVISDKASAGTYFFQNVPTFFSIIDGNMLQEVDYAYKGILFVCPAYNELVKNGGKVFTQEVDLIRSVSKELKE